MSSPTEPPRHPDRIGSYTILGVLGEGGMGLVLAARQDEPISREVAIKVIRAGAEAPRIVARFHAESQTLATLAHPNIARLYEAGTTGDGLPYFVMELIRGEPLTTYCDRRRLGLEDRLALFRTLLGAVQHAHQKTIVHRDIKPSNVLVADVAGQPVLKVIDFGISRVASAEPGLTSSTGAAVRLGTLEYTSPEEVLRSGHGADTRSDIYSLGVLLYELVSGQLPFDPASLRSASPIELEHMLLHGLVEHASLRSTGDPEREREWASRRASDPGQLRHRIRGDLDTIIEVAMARDPASRYSTVARLDDDLTRFQAGLPIGAKVPTLGYRTRKFVARNRYAVSGSAIALTLVLIMATLFTVRLAEERDRAALEGAKAQQVAEFIEGLFEAPDPGSAAAGTMTARELLDFGAARIDDELTDQPEVQSALFGVVGRTYWGLGLWGDAETYLRRALELDQQAREAGTVERAELFYLLGNVLADAGDFDRAEPALREAVALRRVRLGPDDPATGLALAKLSQALRGRGEFDEATALGREAVAILRESPEVDSVALAESLHALAFALRSQAALDEAEALYREALAIYRRYRDPWHPSILQTTSNLALLLEARGSQTEAEDLLRGVLELRRERLGPEHPITLEALNNLAFTLWRTGQYPRATALFTQAVELAERIHGGDQTTFAITLNNLGVAQRRVGAYAESERTHRRALEMDGRLYARPHPRIAGDMDNLGRTLLALGRAEEAEALHSAALAMRIEALGASHPDRAESLSALAGARLALGRGTEAVQLLEEAVRIRTEALGAEHPRTGESLHDLGAAYAAVGALQQAEGRLREALRVRRSALGNEHPDVAATLTELGRLLRESSRLTEARAALAEARGIVQERLDPSDPQRARAEMEFLAVGR